MKPKMYDCPKKITVDQNRHRLEVSQKTQLNTKHFQARTRTSAVGSEIHINADKHYLQGKMV